MKHTKKFASILLALVMAIAMAVPSLAAGEGTNQTQDGKITVTGAHVGHTYTIYKMFDLESYSNVTGTETEGLGTDWSGNFSYKVVEEWKGFFATNANGAKYVTVDEKGYVVSIAENVDAAAFAKDALDWAKTPANGVSAAAESKTASVEEGSEAKTTTVVFDNLALGYYLVDSTAGALCGLNTTAREVNIAEKNTDVPTVEKKVEDSTKTQNDAGIGDTVNFQIIIHAKPGAENYVLHDAMSAGLTFNSDSVKVYKAAVAEGNMITAADNYTVATTALHDKDESEPKCTFEVSFTKAFLDSITEDTDIIVT